MTEDVRLRVERMLRSFRKIAEARIEEEFRKIRRHVPSILGTIIITSYALTKMLEELVTVLEELQEAEREKKK